MCVHVHTLSHTHVDASIGLKHLIIIFIDGLGEINVFYVHFICIRKQIVTVF